jgi:hypothetical protein
MDPCPVNVELNLWIPVRLMWSTELFKYGILQIRLNYCFIFSKSDKCFIF